ncbi:hypothetical protein M427DRAFT_307503 [Gonapodya prolifera JEL478]|uniref:Uncharacterized protein n=1 Tax=Gonapodya prolifera (strain JEL478) TaxID=1344416 RepID=A0A139AHY0_GONPJ|nr:hypothetical protein M427DRAFT_307503 [Gonapodya prolifera JEL478]|eukprot:KXS16013.1 hypothetical protein M427DRAFT_307503 [Gonapodya prolifera JEL478]
MTWNQDDWNRRWYWNFTYPSMLCFAIGRGASVTGWDGGESRWQHDSDKGKVLASKPGYEVKLTSPSSGSDVFEVEKIDPNPAMVMLLLNYGANITPAVLESFWALGDHELIHILERTMMHRIAALQARVSELELRNEDVSKTLKRIQDKKTARAPSPVQAREIMPLEGSSESSSEETPKHPLPESDEKSNTTPPKFAIPALTLTEPTVVLGAPSAPKRALNLPRRVASAGAGVPRPLPDIQAAPEHRPDAEAERLSKVLSNVGEDVPTKTEAPEQVGGKDSDVVQNSAARAQ